MIIHMGYLMYQRHYRVPLSYDLTAFEILGQKLSNFLVGILVQTMTPKKYFEITWSLELLVLLLTYFFRSKSNQIYLNFQSFPVDMLSNNWQKFSYIPQGKSTQRFQCFLQQKKKKTNWNYHLLAQRGKLFLKS